MNCQPPDTVTASEIGEFTFCPEAWRRAAMGTRPTVAIQGTRGSGTAHHAGKASVETAAGRSIDTGRGLILVGATVLVILAELWALAR